MSQALPSLRCHQTSEHDNRNEASHVASTHALKGLNNIVTVSSPNRKDLTTLHGRSYCALLAGEDIFHGNKWFFTHCVKPFVVPYSKTCTITFQSETYLALKQSSDGHENSVPFIACDLCCAWQQCERHAKKVVYQNIDKTSNNSDSKESGLPKAKRLAGTLPVASSIVGQRLTSKEKPSKTDSL